MSKRNDRREAERLARRNNYLATRQSPLDAAEPKAIEIHPVEMQLVELQTDIAAQSATPAQIAANQANALLSTGPVTAGGKARSALNHTSHGLTGQFAALPGEDEFELRMLADRLYAEHSPTTETERLLVQSLIQHHWRTQRAIRLQDQIMLESEIDSKRLNLFLRYQTTHERAYYKALKELQNIQKEKRKNEIGFESQKATQESVEANTRLTNARAQTLEVEAHCRQIMEAPVPGNHNVPFEAITKACSEAIAALVCKERYQSAAA